MTTETQAQPSAGADGVKNVIFMLPDGASAAYAANYRFFKEGAEVPLWEPLLKGAVQTSSFNAFITDSAAGANAYATGVKTRNGTVGEDFFGNELTSVTDLADAAGKATGLVSTAAITDASPAAFGASVPNRNQQAEIARQYILDDQLDVILGAGRLEFLPESEGGTQPSGGLDLISLARSRGFTYATTGEELAAASGERLLGLFSDEDYLDPIGPRPAGEPSLAEMTDAALRALSRDEDGFLLFIEEENTDTFGHANDAATAMHAMASFEASLARVLEFQRENPDTLVVIVADHDTGGMTVEPGLGGNAGATPAVFRDFTATAEEMAGEFDAADPASIRGVVEGSTGLTLTDAEVALVQAGGENADVALGQVLSARGGVRFTTTGHTATDVPIYASGPGAEAFAGQLDNTDVGEGVADALGVSLPASQQDGGALRFEVISLFDTAFGTTPDEGALEYWVQVADGGETADVSRAFADALAGTEDGAFVDLLLANALGDTAAPSGTREFWTGFLAAGGERAEVLEGISDLPGHEAALLATPRPAPDTNLFG
jgi:alkaline phosphatase